MDVSVAENTVLAFLLSYLADNKAVITTILDAEEARKANIQKRKCCGSINGVSIKNGQKNWELYSCLQQTGKYRDLHKLILNSKSMSALYSGYNPDGTRFSSGIQLRKGIS